MMNEIDILKGLLIFGYAVTIYAVIDYIRRKKDNTKS